MESTEIAFGATPARASRALSTTAHAEERAAIGRLAIVSSGKIPALPNPNLITESGGAELADYRPETFFRTKGL
jgi:hypothetical protein